MEHMAGSFRSFQSETRPLFFFFFIFFLLTELEIATSLSPLLSCLLLVMHKDTRLRSE